MEVLQCNITIGSYSFDFVNEVEITSGWKNFTDKATIRIPSSLKVDQNAIKSAFPKGTAVSISLGYASDKLHALFTGYVARVKPTIPLEIECEDEMWKLKQIQVNENARNESMQAYLSRILGVEVDCFDITIPRLVAANITGVQLLDKIKSDYGFPSFMRNGKLVVGKPYDPNNLTLHTVVVDNSKDSTVKGQNLEYTTKDDVKLKVIAISNMDNGKKEQVELGDADGESHTLNFFNIPKSDLQKVAEQEMEKLSYDGYRGDLTLFGVPLVQHGDVIRLKNTQESDKTGDYRVDEVIYRFGVDGFEQKVKPGPKA